MAKLRIFLLSVLLFASLSNARDLRSLAEEQAPLEPEEEIFAQTIELLKEEPQQDLQEEPIQLEEEPLVGHKEIFAEEVLVDPVQEEVAPVYAVELPNAEEDESVVVLSEDIAEPLEEQQIEFREEPLQNDESEVLVLEEEFAQHDEEQQQELSGDEVLLNANPEEVILVAEVEPAVELARNEELALDNQEIEEIPEVVNEPEAVERISSAEVPAERVEEEVRELENQVLPVKTSPLWYFGPVQKDPPSGRFILPPILQFDLPDLTDLIDDNPINTFVVAKLQALQASITALLAQLDP